MSNEPNLDNLEPKPRLKLDSALAEHPLHPVHDPSFAERPHLIEYLKILHKRRWVAVTTFLLVFVTTVVWTFTEVPIFQGRARVLIESEDRNVVSFKEVLEEGQARSDYYQTQYSLLQSRSLARRTIESLKLWDHPLFGGVNPKKSFSVRATVMKGASAVLGLFRAPKEPAPALLPSPNETVTQSRAIDALIRNLIISPVRNSRIVDINFRSIDRELAAKVANAHAKAYIEQNMEFKFMASKEATDWLASRLAESRKEVEAAEQALQKYSEQAGAIGLNEGEDIIVQKLADLNSAVTKAKTQRIEKEALYRQLQSIQSNSAILDTFPAILSNSYIQAQKAELATMQRQEVELAEKYGDKWPDLVKLRSGIQVTQAKLKGEIAKVVQSVNNDFLAAEAQERSLVNALESLKSEAQGMNRKAIPYGVLKREAESARQIYDSLLQRAKETGVSTELRATSIRVVDEAETPRGPISPNVRSSTMYGFAGGLLLAVGLAFFFEYLDNRIKRPEEIKTHLGLPFLGMVPVLSGKFEGRAPLMTGAVPANFAEAFRVVRTNIVFSTAEAGSRSVMVTSTRPGEGKTLVASNIAISLAQAGQRVLLIDADLRRPAVHENFGIQAQPGLSNVLVSDAKASEAVRKGSVPGLWILPAGRTPPNPAELLGSQRFKDFLTTLGEHFDWIIVDSPPVMAVADASVVAHTCTGVLFVVGAEMTSRHAAQVALDQLESSRAKFIGAVLNRVDLEGQTYYYSHYYRREYSRYYTTT
jgi:polysaccharide biosynthesis transport protein